MEPSASPCISKEHSKEHLDNHLQSIVIRGLAKHRENLVITNERRGMTIRQRAWMKKEDWNDINQVLRSNGFRWISNAKDSCWIKTM